MNEQEESTPTARPEGKAARFFERVVRWTVALLVVCALGAGAVFFTLYLPASRDADQVREQATALMDERDDLARRLTDIQAQLKASEERETELQAELNAARIYVAVLSVLVDLNGARLALASDDPSSARVYLNKTPAMLEDLADLLGEGEIDLVPPMQKRLKQVLAGMRSDPDATQSDLEVLVGNLTQLKMNLMWESGRERK